MRVDLSIRDALCEGEIQLGQAGVPEPRVDAEWLLAQVTKQGRLDLTLNARQVLKPEELAQFFEAVTRRAKREPLQHILGSVPFLGHEILVSSAALIPRPETETLAELAIERLRRVQDRKRLRGLDLGTGTGCLSVALALALKNIELDSIDVSTAALELAKRNVELHGLSQRIRLLESDGFSQLELNGSYDFLVSNPPYIPGAEIADLQVEVRDYDPHLALDGGADGLDFYRAIASEGRRALGAGAMVLFEFGSGQGPAIQSIFENCAWPSGTCHLDLCGVERFFEFRNG